jgi:hypothetical protein
MQNNLIMRRKAVAADWQPLVDARLIGSGVISCPPTNSGNIIFEGDDGSEVPWLPGEWHAVRCVDFNEVRVKGTPGDMVEIKGGTW